MNDAASLVQLRQVSVVVRRDWDDGRQNYYIGECGHRLPAESGVGGLLFRVGPCHECDEEPDDERSAARKDKDKAMTTVRPFGLTFMESVPPQPVPAPLAGAVLDQQRHIATFNGRPLCELVELYVNVMK